MVMFSDAKERKECLILKDIELLAKEALRSGATTPGIYNNGALDNKRWDTSSPTMDEWETGSEDEKTFSMNRSRQKEQVQPELDSEWETSSSDDEFVSPR
jgi:hypothetical protein